MGNDRSPESQQVQSLDKVLFFSPYMGMTVILVKFQAYGCNGFHRIIGPVTAYPRPSCHFFPCFHVCLCFQNRPLPTLITYLHLLYQLFASITFQFSGCNSFQRNNILKADGLLGFIFVSESLNFSLTAHFLQDFHLK